MPNQLKVLRGTDRQDRMKPTITAVLISEITEIVDLKNFKVLQSKRAKDLFLQKANQLIKLKILSDMDIEQLVVYAGSLDMLFTCMREIKRKGTFIEIYAEDKAGKLFLKGMIPNPNIKLYREMIEITNRIGSDFGFSPVSRMKLKAEKPEDKDPFQKLLDQLNG